METTLPTINATICGCLHFGTCMKNIKYLQYYCVCKTGFIGKRCEELRYGFSLNSGNKSDPGLAGGLAAGGFLLLILLIISLITWRRCRKIREERRLHLHRCSNQSRATIEGFSTVDGKTNGFQKELEQMKDYQQKQQMTNVSEPTETDSNGLNVPDSPITTCSDLPETGPVNPEQSGNACSQPNGSTTKTNKLVFENEQNGSDTISVPRRKRKNAESHRTIPNKNDLSPPE